jgi:hypothetical protein
VAAVSPTLFASAMGTVTLLVKAGNVVKKSQVLATINSPTLLNQYERERARTCCLPLSERRRHPEFHFFRGSMAGLCTPLSTLRHNPHELQRTTRGRCSSLLLHRDGLSPSSPCRSRGALRLNHTFYSLYSLPSSLCGAPVSRISTLAMITSEDPLTAKSYPKLLLVQFPCIRTCFGIAAELH